MTANHKEEVDMNMMEERLLKRRGWRLWIWRGLKECTGMW
jgi:hypothetical protein